MTPAAVDWSAVSDDDFVAEAQRRANSDNWPPDRYMSQQQADDRAKLGILRSAIVRGKVASIHSGECHPWLIALALTCDQLDGVSGNPLPVQAWAINTTYVGKDTVFQEHRPDAA